jgi:hypothetical protein
MSPDHFGHAINHIEMADSTSDQKLEQILPLDTAWSAGLLGDSNRLQAQVVSTERFS